MSRKADLLEIVVKRYCDPAKPKWPVEDDERLIPNSIYHTVDMSESRTIAWRAALERHAADPVDTASYDLDESVEFAEASALSRQRSREITRQLELHRRRASEAMSGSQWNPEEMARMRDEMRTPARTWHHYNREWRLPEGSLGTGSPDGGHADR